MFNDQQQAVMFNAFIFGLLLGLVFGFILG